MTVTKQHYQFQPPEKYTTPSFTLLALMEQIAKEFP
jgi:hypothetical protein